MKTETVRKAQSGKRVGPGTPTYGEGNKMQGPQAAAANSFQGNKKPRKGSRAGREIVGREVTLEELQTGNTAGKGRRKSDCEAVSLVGAGFGFDRSWP